MHQVMRGTRVLEVASWTFVPAAGAVLADWGADVLKIEHPVTGDPQRGLISSGLIPAGAGGINYIRNAVKVTIDAYHGDTLFYLADPRDPIAATYARMFPGMFRPIDEMPASLRSITYVWPAFAAGSIFPNKRRRANSQPMRGTICSSRSRKPFITSSSTPARVGSASS